MFLLSAYPLRDPRPTLTDVPERDSWTWLWRALWWPLLAVARLASFLTRRLAVAPAVGLAEPVGVAQLDDPLADFRDVPSTGALVVARLLAERGEATPDPDPEYRGRHYDTPGSIAQRRFDVARAQLAAHHRWNQPTGEWLLSLETWTAPKTTEVFAVDELVAVAT